MCEEKFMLHSAQKHSSSGSLFLFLHLQNVIESRYPYYGLLRHTAAHPPALQTFSAANELRSYVQAQDKINYILML